LLAPDLRAHPSAQDVELARLRDVVVGSHGEPIEHRRAIVHCGEHDERDVTHTRCRLDASTRLVAPDPGHQEIEQDAVDRLHREQLERLLARAREHDVVALAMQRGRERLQVRIAVVDREDLARAEQARGLATRRALRAPHRRGQAREQEVRVVLLAQERIGAGIERPELGAQIRLGGQQQTRDRAHRGVEAEAADDGPAVDTGQHEVHDHCIGTQARGDAQALFSARGLEHVVTPLLERTPYDVARGRAVVDDQHRRTPRHRRTAHSHELASARHDVGHVVRLAHVLVGAGLDPTDPIRDLGFRGEHQHRGPGISGSHLAEQVHAVAIGQHDVEHEHVDGLGREHSPRLAERGAGRRGEARRRERVREIHPHREAVIDDEDARGHRRPPYPAPASSPIFAPMSDKGNK
jgi:hypothetical protein